MAAPDLTDDVVRKVTSAWNTAAIPEQFVRYLVEAGVFRVSDEDASLWPALAAKMATKDGQPDRLDIFEQEQDLTTYRQMFAGATRRIAELEQDRERLYAELSKRQARIDAALATGSEDEQDDLTRALTAAESGEAYGWPIIADVLRREILRVRAALTTDPA